MSSENRRAVGEAIRRQVMGDSFVDAALANADAFTQPFQDHVNEFCWGLTWARPGIAMKDRSLWTLAVLAATGKYTELKGHTRGALRNGCTPDEIAELFLQVAVYAGVPAAVESFRTAQPVIAEFAQEQNGSARD